MPDRHRADRDLRLVGLVFDSNFAALGNDYVYRSDEARAISVDVRALIEALRHVYDAERLLDEVLYRPEAEAATPSGSAGG